MLGLAAPADAAEPVGTVRGVLQDEAGGLLVRDESVILVSLYRDDELETPALTMQMGTGDLGEFELTDVPAGRYAVKFAPVPGWNPWRVGEWWGDTRRAAERAFIEVTDGGVVELEARLSSTVRLRGTVTGRQLAFPVAKSSITVAVTSGDAELDDWLPWRSTTIRLGESYSFNVIPGTYDLSFADTTGAHSPLTVGDVVATSPSTTTDVALQAARASISGTWSLRTAEGIVPMRQGSVLLYKLSAGGAWVKQSATCAGSGTSSAFLLDCLSAGRYKLGFSHSGIVTGYWGGEDLDSATEIVLAKNQTFAGIDAVVDAHAELTGVIGVRAEGTFYPSAGVGFDVWRRTAAGFVPVPGAVEGYTVWGETGGAGEFYGYLAPGRYVLRFDPGHGPSMYYGGAASFERATEISVGPGEHLDLGTLALPSAMKVGRIAGDDRFATAVAVSKKLVPSGGRAPVVYLTNAFDFPDALAAAPAAMRAGGVVLPVSRDAIPAGVASELSRLRPSRVVVAGGTGAVSTAVVTAVRAILPDAAIVRLGGASRYQTADLIVRDAFGGEGSRHAILATGAAYPDALAAGPAAGHLDAPVILVDGARGLTRETKATIAKLGITDVYIAGGKGAVGADLESELRSLLGKGKVKRLAGSDRVFTAIEVNDAIFGSVDRGYVAGANGFADALAGAPLAGSHDAPLYLSAKTCINYWTLESLRFRNAAQLTLLGGTGVLGSSVAALRTCD